MSDGSGWRWCPLCGETKPADEFYADRPQKGRTRLKKRLKCRQCTRAQMRARYADRLQFIDDYKLARGCTDCGWADHPKALEFDHLPGVEKRTEIARMVSQTGAYSLDDIKAEMAKCEVVCANCHRIRTYDRVYGNADWDLRHSSRTADQIGRKPGGTPPYEQLTLEV